jgi:hypothetical protein
MAFKKVELTEEEQKGSGGRKFKKFDAVGDKALALFVKTARETANYADGPKDVTKYIFWNRTDGEFEVTPPMDLEQKLKKAMRPESEKGFGLEAGKGHLVKMVFTHVQDIPNSTNKKKVFDVEVDTAPDVAFHKGAPPEVLHARNGSTPASDEDDDIPF